jgi:hypothetical protein
MLPMVEFPFIVQHYAPYFKDVFSEEAWIEFERYISGLIVSENKTVEGINRLCVMESRNQSSLNRLLTKSPYSLQKLNEARLHVMDSLPETKIKRKGVLSIDDTLLSHYGQEFEEITKLYDPVTDSYVWAHNLVTLHYSDDQTDYPLAFQLWKPVKLEKLEAGMRAAGIDFPPEKEAWKTSDPRKWRLYLRRAWTRRLKKYPQLSALYETKLDIAKALLRQWLQIHPDEQQVVTFDDWYTEAEFCQYIDQELHLAYVGTLAGKDALLLKQGKTDLATFASQLKAEHLDKLTRGEVGVFEKITIAYKGRKEVYYTYCNTHNLCRFGHQRLVINYRQEDLSDDPAFFISNRLYWHAEGITRIRRHRWPVEVYHEEGKDEGIDQYQLRDFEAIQRHVALVAVVYSLLRAAQHDPLLRQQLQRLLKLPLEGSAAFWRRASQAHALWCLGLLINMGLSHGQSLHKVLAPVLHAVCYR